MTQSSGRRLDRGRGRGLSCISLPGREQTDRRWRLAPGRPRLFQKASPVREWDCFPGLTCPSLKTSLVAQTVMRLPTMPQCQRPGLIPRLGRSGEANGNPHQYSCLENPMDGVQPVGYSPWGLAESDRTERLHLHFSLAYSEGPQVELNGIKNFPANAGDRRCGFNP